MIMKNEVESKLTRRELKEIEFRVVAALSKLYETAPFYYHFLKQIPKSFDHKMEYAAGVLMDKRSRRVRLVINPEKVKNHSVNDFCILLQHESLHVAFGHLLDSKIKRSSTAMSFNRACDYFINDHIPELINRYPKIKENLGKARAEIADILGSFNPKVNGHPDEIEKAINGLTDEQYKEIKPKLEEICDKYTKIEPFTFACTKPAIEHVKEIQGLDFKNTTSNEIYDILFKNRDQENEKNKMAIKVSIGEPGDDHDSMEGPDGNPLQTDELLSEEIKNAIKEAAKDALASAKQLGNMPGNLSKIIFEMLKSKTNYIQIINAFATSVRDVDNTRTWTRQHRKYPNQTPGRKREHRPSIALILDTSGSMWDERIQKIMVAEIKALKDVCSSVYIVMGDTQETARIDLTDEDFDVTKFKLVGGGGTDLNFGFKAARELKVDGAIFHSDGFISEIVDDFNIPTLWMIYPGGQSVKPEKYKNVHIEECL
jgi:predicted metal-dependent peptidase